LTVRRTANALKGAPGDRVRAVSSPRTLSLLPSATELVFALGLGDLLVGRSEECDYPLEARRLPVVMKARAHYSQWTSTEIDRHVRESLGRAEDLYEIDETLLEKLAPDLVLTQDLCDVCSVTPPALERALRRLRSRPEVLTLSPRTLEDVLNQISPVARALGHSERGQRLETRLRGRLRACQGSVPRSQRRRVLLLEWLDPPIVPGLWAPEMVEWAGGTPAIPTLGAPLKRVTWEEVRSAGADLVILSPCSFPLKRTVEELSGPVGQRLQDLHPELGVWAVDEAFFSRPGPRVVEGIELLSDFLVGTGRPRPRFQGRTQAWGGARPWPLARRPWG
jgi:iron complex transport system substrate-binding protein